MPVDLDGSGDVSCFVEKHIFIGLQHHHIGVIFVLCEPFGAHKSIGVGVLRQILRHRGLPLSWVAFNVSQRTQQHVSG